MLEYIIVTKPAEKEDKNTIKLMNGQILQAGLKKDVESLDSYFSHLNWAEHFEKHSGQKLEKHYYFVNGGIRIQWRTEDADLELFPIKPCTSMQGCIYSLAKTANILYQLDKKLKEIFPEAEYALKIKYLTCCSLQPRIIFKKADVKQIKKTFPEFPATDEIDKTDFGPSIIPAGLTYEADYSEHDGYYDCRRCDPGPSWGICQEEKPKPDPTDDFCEQKIPHRKKGNPRANCFGTKNK